MSRFSWPGHPNTLRRPIRILSHLISEYIFVLTRSFYLRDREDDLCRFLGPVTYILFIFPWDFPLTSLLLSEWSLVPWTPSCVVTQEPQKTKVGYRVRPMTSSVVRPLRLPVSVFCGCFFRTTKIAFLVFCRRIVLSFENLSLVT